MRRLLCVVVVSLAATASAQAAAPSERAAPVPNASAFYIVNASNGEVLASHDAQVELPIASLTKLMTVIIALQHLKLDDEVIVTRSAARVGEERIPLVAGQRITVRDLLKGALIQSANNAADALAAAASGGDIPLFVSWMNARARAIGLHHTHFERPDGLEMIEAARQLYGLDEASPGHGRGHGLLKELFRIGERAGQRAASKTAGKAAHNKEMGDSVGF